MRLNLLFLATILAIPLSTFARQPPVGYYESGFVLAQIESLDSGIGLYERPMMTVKIMEIVSMESDDEFRSEELVGKSVSTSYLFSVDTPAEVGAAYCLELTEFSHIIGTEPQFYLTDLTGCSIVTVDPKTGKTTTTHFDDPPNTPDKLEFVRRVASNRQSSDPTVGRDEGSDFGGAIVRNGNGVRGPQDSKSSSYALRDIVRLGAPFLLMGIVITAAIFFWRRRR